MSKDLSKKPALPRNWIIPIRLGVYLSLIATGVYIYMNLGKLEWTHFLIILPVFAIGSMVILDCRLSEDYWKKHDLEKQQTE